jgi:hypothetical protein
MAALPDFMATSSVDQGTTQYSWPLPRKGPSNASYVTPKPVVLGERGDASKQALRGWPTSYGANGWCAGRVHRKTNGLTRKFLKGLGLRSRATRRIRSLAQSVDGRDRAILRSPTMVGMIHSAGSIRGSDQR